MKLAQQGLNEFGHSGHKGLTDEARRHY